MYQHRRHGVIAAVALVGALLAPALSAATQPPPPDNTKTNKRDRAKGAATADQQKENGTDREITRKIRRALMDDKALSTYAHNVKVITQSGKVTLKGPVRTEEEKKAVEARASAVAGAGNITNQISIAPAKTSKE